MMEKIIKIFWKTFTDERRRKKKKDKEEEKRKKRTMKNCKGGSGCW